MPKNAKNSVYKQKEFDLYVLWKFLPAHFKGLGKKELASLGFTDPLILKIIKIKNQTEFANYFHIKDLGTLTDWNNKIKNETSTSPLALTDFQKQYSRINQEILLPTISELKEKISKQNKLLDLLKKENDILKNEIKLATTTKKEIIPITAVPVQEPLSLPNTNRNLSKDKEQVTLLQKIKNIFLHTT